MDVVKEDKKSLKHLLALKRSKKDWQLFRHVQRVQEKSEALREKDQEVIKSFGGDGSARHSGSDEWHGKTQEVRNRLTGKKRDAKERWNRFAGTGDEGGRGL